MLGQILGGVASGLLGGIFGQKASDNAAAVAGGLSVGEIYATATGELRIVV
jgi:uncharacterized protein YcfJ